MYKTFYPKTSRMFDSLLPFSLSGSFNHPMFNNDDEFDFMPRVDVVETEQKFELHVALPGMEKENIKVEVKDNVLTISGERKQITEEGKTFKTVETRYGKFSRSFRLGEKTNASLIDAQFKNGILTIDIPKKEIESKENTLVEIK